jgi:hypothetical protein
MKTKLVHVRLEPDRVIFLCTEAKRRGISVDELVQQAPFRQKKSVKFLTKLRLPSFYARSVARARRDFLGGGKVDDLFSSALCR